MEGADGVHHQKRIPGREVVSPNKPTILPKPLSKTSPCSEREKVTDGLPALPPTPIALSSMLDSGNERTLSFNRSSVPVKPVPHPPQFNGRHAEVPGKSLGADESVVSVLGEQPEYEYVSSSPRETREPSKKTFQMHFKEIGKKMTLKEFCNKGKKLPCLVKVTTGYTSFCERYSFATDELLVVIEMKEIDAVRIRDNSGPTKKEMIHYDVPLNSSLFSVVPSLDPEWKSVKGVVLTPQYLLGSHESLPNVLYSTSEWTTFGGRVLPSGSFLFPQAVKKKKQERILVAKLADGFTVEITSECSGSFTTFRSATDNLSLSTAVKCVKLPFECTLKPLGNDLFCDRVTIESVRKELFLFGVMKVRDGSIEDDVNSFQQLLEVPVNLNILVVTMIPEDENLLEDIYESAQSYYNVNLRAESKRIRKDASIQGGVKGGHSPPRLHVATKDPQPLHGLSHKDPLNSNSLEIPTRSKVKGHSPSSSHASMKGPKPLHGPTQALKSNSRHFKQGAHRRPLPDIPVPTATAASVIPISHSRTYELVDSGKTRPPTTPPIASQQNHLYNTMAPYSTLPNSPDTATNICNLKLLEPMGILDVLDAINLSVYKESFQKELIDGELLSEFTEDMFIELGVKSKIHRLKLMQVVKGRKDVSSVLNKK